MVFGRVIRVSQYEELLSLPRSGFPAETIGIDIDIVQFFLFTEKKGDQATNSMRRRSINN